MFPHRRILLAPLLLAVACAQAAHEAAAQPTPPAASEYSEIAPLATKSLLLDAAMAGPRMVAVGERGHILTSDDQGQTWRQAKVPTRNNLTGVYFADDKHGWAVGHDEVILRTEDGGETWTLVHSAPEKEQPLLAVWFKDAYQGLAIGAYGTVLASKDGGRTWEQRTFDPKPLISAAAARAASDDKDEFVDAPTSSDMHLNSIVEAGDGSLLIAAESGHVFRSTDDGATWTVLPSPYEGSFFGVLPLEGKSLLVFGLRGHLFRSDDGGLTWRQIETGTVAMLTDAARADERTIVVSGLAGTLLVSRDGGQSFTLVQQPDRKGIAAVLAIDANRILAVGEGGVRTVSL